MITASPQPPGDAPRNSKTIDEKERQYENHPLIRLAELATEIGITVDELAARLDPNSIRLDAVGFRSCEPGTAAKLIDDHRAAEQRRRDRDHKRRAEAARRPDPVRQRRQALRAQAKAQRELVADGMSALAVLAASDPDHPSQRRLDRSGRRFDELASGVSIYHNISPQKER